MRTGIIFATSGSSYINASPFSRNQVMRETESRMYLFPGRQGPADMAANSMIRIKDPMIDEFQFPLKSESTAQPAD